MLKLKDLRGLAALTLLLALAVDLFGNPRRYVGSDVDAATDAARQRLLPGDLLAPADNGTVEALELNVRLPAQVLLRSATRATGSDGITFFNLPGASDFSASAMGVDLSQHIVNTYLQGYAPFTTHNVWTPLFALARRKTYMTDELQYAGKKEIWQTSKQAFSYTRGDCEDHAIMLADWLSALGHDARVVLGKYQDEGHAWVVLFADNRQFILEATQKAGVQRLIQYPLAATLPDYHPLYMFNRTQFWTNTGSMFTTQYQTAKWVKKSRYYANQSG